MTIKKSLLVVGAIATVGTASLAGTGLAHASSNPEDSAPNGLIAKIARKFNLNPDEVKAVFEQERTEHHAQRQQKLEQGLTQAVTDGKITPEQKDKIVTKLQDLQAQMTSQHDGFSSKAPDERRALTQQQGQDLQQWAEENGIPLQYLRLGMGGPRGGDEPGGPMGQEPPAEQLQ